MNPGLYPDFSSMQQGTVLIPVQWTSGATGAVPALSAFTYSAGVKSVTRNSAGDFTIVFKGGAAAGFIGMDENIVQASYSNTGACYAIIKVNSLKTKGTFSVEIMTVNAAGAATDPTTGDVIALLFTLQYVNPK